MNFRAEKRLTQSMGVVDVNGHLKLCGEKVSLEYLTTVMRYKRLPRQKWVDGLLSVSYGSDLIYQDDGVSVTAGKRRPLAFEFHPRIQAQAWLHCS